MTNDDDGVGDITKNMALFAYAADGEKHEVDDVPFDLLT